MHIALFGASGKVGSQLLNVLLERGHNVTVLVHNKKLKLAEVPNLKIITGDIYNPADVFKVIDSCEVVVSTLGSWGSKNKDIVSTATKNIIPAMEKARVKRFVSVTGGSAKLPNEKFSLIPNAMHFILGFTAKPIVNDAEEHLRLLASSNLDWTSIRAPIMTNQDTSKYRLSMEPVQPWATISRHAVVTAMLNVIENDTFHAAAPFISSK